MSPELIASAAPETVVSSESTPSRVQEPVGSVVNTFLNFYVDSGAEDRPGCPKSQSVPSGPSANPQRWMSPGLALNSSEEEPNASREGASSDGASAVAATPVAVPTAPAVASAKQAEGSGSGSQGGSGVVGAAATTTTTNTTTTNTTGSTRATAENGRRISTDSGEARAAEAMCAELETLLQLPEDMQLQLVPLDEDGQKLSLGTIPHLRGHICRPCAFAHREGSKCCVKGALCLFCHLDHPRTKKFKPSKRQRAERRAKMLREAAAGGAAVGTLEAVDSEGEGEREGDDE